MKDKLAKGVVWLASAKVIINMLALGSTLLLARLLTPEDFGLFALANTMLFIITAVTELSMASALIHHDNPTDAHFNTAWTLNLIRAIAVGILFCIGAPLASWIYHEPRLLNVMLLLGFSLMLVGFNNPKTVILTRNLVFWQQFALTVSQKLGGFLVGVTIAIIYKSYWALVAGTVASQLIGIVISYVIIPFRPKFSFVHVKELWSFSIWLTLGQLVNTFNWKLDILLVGGYLGTETLGYYTVGDNLAGLATRETVGPIEATLFPGFALIKNDNTRLKKAYSSAQTLITAIALPAGVGLALVAHPLVLLAMGEKWLPAVEIIQVIAVTIALLTLSSSAHSLAMAQGETKLLFFRDLISFLIRVPMIILGLYYSGLIGILVARATSTVISIIMNMYIVKRLIGSGLIGQLSANIRTIISVIAMTAVVLILEHFIGRDGSPHILIVKLAIFISAGASIYIMVRLLLWVIAKKPTGPETEIINISSKLLLKFRSN